MTENCFLMCCGFIGLISIGERAGQRVRRVLQDPEEGIRTGDLCYASSGLTANDDWTNLSTRPEKYSPLDFSDNEFSLHAATRIAAGNKDGLERLCTCCCHHRWRINKEISGRRWTPFRTTGDQTCPATTSNRFCHVETIDPAVAFFRKEIMRQRGFVFDYYYCDEGA